MKKRTAQDDNLRKNVFRSVCARDLRRRKSVLVSHELLHPSSKTVCSLFKREHIFYRNCHRQTSPPEHPTLPTPDHQNPNQKDRDHFEKVRARNQKNCRSASRTTMCSTPLRLSKNEQIFFTDDVLSLAASTSTTTPLGTKHYSSLIASYRSETSQESHHPHNESAQLLFATHADQKEIGQVRHQMLLTSMAEHL